LGGKFWQKGDAVGCVQKRWYPEYRYSRKGVTKKLSVRRPVSKVGTRWRMGLEELVIPR
jgi:hypothetical protein